MDPTRPQLVASQDAWRNPQRPARPTRRPLPLRRLLLLLLMSIALLFLAWYLLRPFWHARTHIVILPAGDAGILNAPPVPFVDQDITRFDELRRVAELHDGDNFADLLNTPRAVKGLGKRLQQLNIGGADTLILFVSAHGVTYQGKPYLVCNNFDPRRPQKGLCELEDLLAELRGVPAAGKLLVLNTGSMDDDFQKGLLVSEFPRLVEEVVQRNMRDDAGLRVLVAYSPLEKSRVSLALKGTVFSVFVAKGLEGAADLNSDDHVDVDELEQFVSACVSDWVEQSTGGAASQTPLLLPRQPRPALTRPLVSLRGMPAESRDVDINRMIQIAQNRAGNSLPSPPPSTTSRGLLARYAGDRQVGNGHAASPPGATAASSDSNQNASAESGESQTAAAGPQSGDADASDKSSAAAEKDPRARLFELIDQAWQLRDRLAGQSHLAPQLWRELNEELLENERRWLVGHAGTITSAETTLTQSLKAIRAAEAQGTSALPRQRPADRPEPLKPTKPAHSLALAELLADEGALPSTPDLKPLRTLLDQISRDPPEDLAKWIEEQDGGHPKWDRFYELQLVRQLAAMPELDAVLMTLAVSTRNEGEKAAACGIWCSAWLRQQINWADRLRLSGEREIRDQIGRRWQQRAETFLNQAKTVYQQAVATAGVVRQARQLRDELVLQAPDFVHWYIQTKGTAGAPKSVSLVSFLDGLVELNHVLEQPSFAKLPTIKQLTRRLKRLRTEMVAGAEPETLQDLVRDPIPGTLLRIEQLLNSTLVPGSQRLELLQGIEQLEATVAQEFELTSMPKDVQSPDFWQARVDQARLESPDSWQARVDQARLELKLARLAVGATDSAALENPEEAFGEFQKECELAKSSEESGAEADDQRPSRYRGFVKELSTFYRGLHDRVASPQKSQYRANANLQRVQAERALQMLDPRDAWQVTGMTMPQLSRSVDLFDTLAWQRDRILLARLDASPDEIKRLSQTAELYRQQTIALLQPGDVVADLANDVRLLTVSWLSLENRDQAEVVAELNSWGAAPKDAWLILQYDPELLHVQASFENAGAKIYHEHLLREQLASNAGQQSVAGQPFTANFPFSRELLSLSPTTLLTDGGTQKLRLLVTRKSARKSTTRLAVKVVVADQLSADAAETRLDLNRTRLPDQRSAVYLRRQIEVLLPVFQLAIAGTPGSWESSSPREFRLLPFPGQKTGFRLGVTNTGAKDRKVTMRVFVLDRKTPLDWSSKALPELLKNLQPLVDPKSKAVEYTLEVPHDNEPQWPGDEPAQDEEAPEVEQPEEEAPTEDEPAKPPQGPRMPLDLLVELSEQDQPQRKIVKRIRIVPQRPRRYLRPRVHYSMTNQRIEVTIVPRFPSMLPDKPISTRCNVVEGLPAAAEGKLEGTLDAPDYRARMFVNVPSTPPRIVTLTIDVDGYPRAFVYKVPCGQEPWSMDLPEESVPLAVQVVNREPYLPVTPEDRAEGVGYQASTVATAVEIRIDAPIGSFETGDDVLHLGIDADEDGKWDTDSPLEFRSDRQADVHLESVGKDGSLVLDTRVADWRSTLRTAGFENVNVDIVGQAVIDGQATSIRPRRPKTTKANSGLPLERTQAEQLLKLRFDSAAPRVTRIEISPEAPFYVTGSEIKVDVWLSDRMSGVESVVAALVSPGTEVFPEGAKPVSAVFIQPHNRWTLQLPVGDVPGPQAVLVQAIDKVGNRYAVAEELRLLTPEQIEAELKELPVTMSGVVRYRQDKIANAEVKLFLLPELDKPLATTTSNDSGGYSFKKLAAGEYAVVVRSVVRNVVRAAEVSQVLADPLVSGNVQVDVHLE